MYIFNAVTVIEVWSKHQLERLFLTLKWINITQGFLWSCEYFSVLGVWCPLVFQRRIRHRKTNLLCQQSCKVPQVATRRQTCLSSLVLELSAVWLSSSADWICSVANDVSKSKRLRILSTCSTSHQSWLKDLITWRSSYLIALMLLTVSHEQVVCQLLFPRLRVNSHFSRSV